MTLFLTKEQQAEILTTPVQRLLTALRGAVVGGAVRDVILNRKVGDIDLASPLPPERMIEALSAQGIKTKPTGIAHGTITAVIDHVGYEITTLRRDVRTDGRHAEVAYTDDWREDAARRDFTFNALYVDAEGNLSDYFGGVDDAKTGRVRFIGDARARIQEDVLRILRFFRFTASFGRGEPDGDAIAACRELAPLIPRLSVERVAREMAKLLGAEDPVPALRLMQECGVTQHFAPEASDLSRLESLLAAETLHNAPTSAWTRLAALLPQDEAVAAVVAARLKLSKRDGETLCVLAKLPELLRGQLSPAALRRQIYAFGANYCRDAVLLNGEQIHDSLATIAAWESPVFPIRGEDIVKLGIPAGPQIGKILCAIEKWWIAGDFRANRKACLEYAGKLI
ncbi:MAG: CCA tRNA nucleotidyltransferase [Alphaproteobacteria bacterium]|nr:CCA tRNA nucleotidyltransferase [Alphaproteobacteria bacterium]